MKKLFSWQAGLSIFLIALSGLLYFLHFKIFHDAHHIFIYFLGDLAFIPIEVLLVTLVIHHLLDMREKRAMLNKLNMVVGAFYSEAGTQMIKDISGADPQSAKISGLLLVRKEWQHKEFLKVSGEIKAIRPQVNISGCDLGALRDFLKQKREFFLRLLENPNLLEHETFTELLWAVFHLTEELVNRPTLKGLPQSDYDHLSNDISRAYGLLISEWLAYIEHLNVSYPYLFSLAVRTNPFDSKASVVIKS